MLKKKNRFDRSDFSSFLLFPTLKTVYNPLGTLKFIKGTQKLAIVTSSRGEKRAVFRNKLRRRIYSQASKKALKIKGILYVSKQSYAMDRQTIQKFYDDLMERADRAS